MPRKRGGNRRRLRKRGWFPGRLALFLVLLLATGGAAAYLLLIQPGTFRFPALGGSAPDPRPPAAAPPEAPSQAKAAEATEETRPTDTRPKVALILDDVGHRREIARQYLDSDLVITFAVLPYAPYAADIAHEASRAGRDVMLHLPMEPTNHDWDPGPDAIRTGMDVKSIARILDQDLRVVPMAVAVNNHMGSRLTEDRETMLLFLRALKDRRLAYVDSLTSPRSLGRELATEVGVPAIARDIFLDNVQDAEAIAQEIDRLVAIAKKSGTAIGIGHATYPLTLETLLARRDKLAEVNLVGIREILR